MLRTMDNAMAGLASLLHALATLCLILMLVLINFEVGMRYLFNSSTMISDEYSGYFFCWLIMTGLLSAARGETFLRVEFGVDLLPPHGQNLARLIASVAGLGVTAILTYACFQVTSTSFRFGNVSLQFSETPLWMPQTVMVFGLGLLTIHYLFDIARRIALMAGRS